MDEGCPLCGEYLEEDGLGDLYCPECEEEWEENDYDCG